MMVMGGMPGRFQGARSTDVESSTYQSEVDSLKKWVSDRLETLKRTLLGGSSV
ncbi:MAG: hypothetical protein JXR23_07365 [Pontiellaceae bacterium]|nr:hypothetical protein [Pontiellaceae bacterium]